MIVACVTRAAEVMRHVIRFLDSVSVLYEYVNDDVVLISIPAGLISS